MLKLQEMEADLNFWMYKGSFRSSFVEVPLSIYHDSLILINPVVIFSVMLCHT